jgi:hypothetical protein
MQYIISQENPLQTAFNWQIFYLNTNSAVDTIFLWFVNSSIDKLPIFQPYTILVPQV